MGQKFPLAHTIWSAAPAGTSGCALVVKPAEYTLLKAPPTCWNGPLSVWLPTMEMLGSNLKIFTRQLHRSASIEQSCHNALPIFHLLAPFSCSLAPKLLLP